MTIEVLTMTDNRINVAKQYLGVESTSSVEPSRFLFGRVLLQSTGQQRSFLSGSMENLKRQKRVFKMENYLEVVHGQRQFAHAKSMAQIKLETNPKRRTNSSFSRVTSIRYSRCSRCLLSLKEIS